MRYAILGALGSQSGVMGGPHCALGPLRGAQGGPMADFDRLRHQLSQFVGACCNIFYHFLLCDRAILQNAKMQNAKKIASTESQKLGCVEQIIKLTSYIMLFCTMYFGGSAVSIFMMVRYILLSNNLILSNNPELIFQ